MVDRRNASEWVHPELHVAELPHLPVAIRADDPAWAYVKVRRLGAYVEQSIDHGLQWTVFEPNDRELWQRVHDQVTSFLLDLWREGRLIGRTADEAFTVKVDRSTMTQDDIDHGRLVVLIGIAPVRPAEFVVIRIGQWALGHDPDDD